jgi:hypothetical protein
MIHNDKILHLNLMVYKFASMHESVQFSPKTKDAPHLCSGQSEFMAWYLICGLIHVLFLSLVVNVF